MVGRMMRTFFLNELPNQTEVWREKSEREWKGKVVTGEASTQEECLRQSIEPS